MTEEEARAQAAWDARAKAEERRSTERRLYDIYAGWTGQLHHYCVKHLGRHVDCEFYPATWRFGIFSGHAQEKSLQVWNFSTVPALTRPAGEAKETIQLPRPEDNPSQEDLDAVFKILCLAAARILEIDLGKPKLPPNRGTPQLRKRESTRIRRKTLGPRKTEDPI